jgi:hypothetical protein
MNEHGTCGASEVARLLALPILFAGGLCHGKGGGRPGGEGAAYANLGNAYKSQGDYAKAIEHHGQHQAIAKEVGDRAGEGIAYANLGTCHMHLNEDYTISTTHATHAHSHALTRLCQT